MLVIRLFRCLAPDWPLLALLGIRRLVCGSEPPPMAPAKLLIVLHGLVSYEHTHSWTPCRYARLLAYCYGYDHYLKPIGVVPHVRN